MCAHTQGLRALRGLVHVSQGLRANAVTYATLVDAHVRAGELARARQTLAAAAEDGVRVDAWSWTALIKGLADAGDMRVRQRRGCAYSAGHMHAAQKSLKLLRQMSDKSVATAAGVQITWSVLKCPDVWRADSTRSF